MSSVSDGPAGSPRLLRPPVPAQTEVQKVISEEITVAQPQNESTPEVVFDPPTMGWQAQWWKILQKVNPSAQPPAFGKKEQNIRNTQEEALRQAELLAWRVATRNFSENRMRHLTDEVTGFTVVYIGVKGSAATTTTMVNASSILADVTRTTVYAADFNPASGTAGGRLGKNFDETISLREFGVLIESMGDNPVLTREQVNAKLRPTRYGVRVLNADDYTLETTEQFGTKTRKMLKVLKENCDYLEIDTPNDIQTAASKAVLEKADVLVFTANVPEPDSLRLLYTSMEKVRQLGLSAKVANSIALISNIPPGNKLVEYRKYLNRTDIDHVVIQKITEADFKGQFLGVPHDPVIARAGRVELEAYAWETKQAYIDLVNAEFEQAFKVLSCRSIPNAIPFAPANN